MTLSLPRFAVWRAVALTLAMLAVALKVAVPPGFMAAEPARGLPFGLVICSAQGAVTAAALASGGHDPSGHAPANSAHDSPCAFAGHGVQAAPASLADPVRAEFVAYQAFSAPRPVSLAPGRGLAAPPLPARGPPSLLT